MAKSNIISENCSVTAFSLKVKILEDGRRRGLWFCLEDNSNLKQEWERKNIENAINNYLDYLKVPRTGIKRFDALMRFDSMFSFLLRNQCGPMALLEWPACIRVSKKLSKRLKSNKPSKSKSKKQNI